MGFLFLLYFSLSYLSLCGLSIICCSEGVHSAHGSSSGGIPVYVGIDLMCPWEVRSGSLYAAKLNYLEAVGGRAGHSQEHASFFFWKAISDIHYFNNWSIDGNTDFRNACCGPPDIKTSDHPWNTYSWFGQLIVLEMVLELTSTYVITPDLRWNI